MPDKELLVIPLASGHYFHYKPKMLAATTAVATQRHTHTYTDMYMHTHTCTTCQLSNKSGLGRTSECNTKSSQIKTKMQTTVAHTTCPFPLSLCLPLILYCPLSLPDTLSLPLCLSLQVREVNAFYGNFESLQA